VVTCVHCTYDPASRGGNSPDGRKVKGTLHWVSADDSLPFTAKLYDRLFNAENPSDESKGSFKDNLNPDSLIVLEGCRLEGGLSGLKPGDTFQFMRQGYFCVDTTSTPEKTVFNRTVQLNSSWK
ncbi:MAG: glutamine--tRNA ligase, partial [Clostridia bacterium]|nr:glutamine--tRNA ligase [Clostridia bacterium]